MESSVWIRRLLTIGVDIVTLVFSISGNAEWTYTVWKCELLALWDGNRVQRSSSVIYTEQDKPMNRNTLSSIFYKCWIYLEFGLACTDMFQRSESNQKPQLTADTAVFQH